MDKINAKYVCKLLTTTNFKEMYYRVCKMHLQHRENCYLNTFETCEKGSRLETSLSFGLEINKTWVDLDKRLSVDLNTLLETCKLVWVMVTVYLTKKNILCCNKMRNIQQQAPLVIYMECRTNGLPSVHNPCCCHVKFL